MKRVRRALGRVEHAVHRIGPFSTGLALGLIIPLPLVALVRWISILAGGKPEPGAVLPTLNTTEVKGGALAGARLIRYYGFISTGGNSLLSQRIEHTPKDRPLWIEMNSVGGELIAAGDLAKYLNNNGVGVAVAANAQCTSACVLVYASTARRYAPFNSYFGFHYKTWSRLLFAFGRLTGGYRHVYPMTTEMNLLSEGITGHSQSLTTFFGGCSHGNPSFSEKPV